MCLPGEGYIWPKVSLIQRLTKLQVDLTWYCSWPLHASTGHMSELRSTGPNLVPLLATRCIYQGYIWTQINWIQLNTALGHQMPLPGEGYIWPKVSLIQRLTKYQADLIQYHSWPLDASIGGSSEFRSTRPNLVLLLATRCSTGGYIWAQVNWTQLSTVLGHQMPLLGVHLSSGQLDPTEYHSWPLDASTWGGHLT